MHILPFIVIILCQYASIAANKTPISLDINTRKDTDQVKVTKEGENNMVIYKIEPQKDYKIGKFVDGNKIIYEPPKGGENFKYLEVKSNKATNYEPILVSLIYSDGWCTKSGINYFIVENEWKRVSKGIVEYLIKLLKEGEKIVREVELEAYVAYTKERKKKSAEIEIDLKKPVPQGVTRTEEKEGWLFSNTFMVNDNTIIIRVKGNGNQVWRLLDYVCGCYYIKVYYSSEVSTFVILHVKYPKEMKIFYYGLNSSRRFEIITKEDFDARLKKLAEDTKAKSQSLRS